MNFKVVERVMLLLLLVGIGASRFASTTQPLNEGPVAWTDLNDDGRINVEDAAVAAEAFGSCPADPRWNLQADINLDGKVDIMDVLLIVRDFGTIGRKIDLCMQYPAPYGGQGFMQSADVVTPQQEVLLTALVSYNGSPLQSNGVAFTVIDSHGSIWQLIPTLTNASGIASATFGMPWPAENPENLFGVWTVKAETMVEGGVITDVVKFPYDYLVHVWNVTTDKREYTRLESVNVTVDFGSCAMRIRTVYLIITMTDSTGLPFAYTIEEVEIEGSAFGSYKNGSRTVSMYIPNWAALGQASVIVGFLDAPPWEGGKVISGPATIMMFQIIAP